MCVHIVAAERKKYQMIPCRAAGRLTWLARAHVWLLVVIKDFFYFFCFFSSYMSDHFSNQELHGPRVWDGHGRGQGFGAARGVKCSLKGASARCGCRWPTPLIITAH